MKISLIGTSHRKDSQSLKCLKFFEKNLKQLDANLDLFSLDFGTTPFPHWSPDKRNGKGVWGKEWKNISNNFKDSSGFIVFVPEYGGMAAPNAKNFFLLCGEGELAHKPGLIVSISSGNGGAYPISEIRSSSYKNTHLMWIPENIIIRNVDEFNPGNHGKNIPEWLDNRIDYVLKLFLAYSFNMKPIRKIVNRKEFGNGM